MNNDIAARIDLILLEFQLTPSAFSDAIQIPRSIMSHILSRRNKPSLEVVQKILKKYPQINTDWLLTGMGTMIQLNIFDEEIISKPSEAIEKTITPIEKSFTKSEKPSYEASISNIKADEKLQRENLVSDHDPIKNLSDVGGDKKEEQKLSELFSVSPILNEKKIEKIVFFYSDKSFSIHLPE